MAGPGRGCRAGDRPQQHTAPAVSQAHKLESPRPSTATAGAHQNSRSLAGDQHLATKCSFATLLTARYKAAVLAIGSKASVGGSVRHAVSH